MPSRESVPAGARLTVNKDAAITFASLLYCSGNVVKVIVKSLIGQVVDGHVVVLE